MLKKIKIMLLAFAMIIPYIINQNQVNAKSSWLLQTISADNHMGWTNDEK